MQEYALERPILAVDIVIFRVEAGELQVLLHRRAEEPYQGALGFPGVAARLDETLENAARRALTLKINWPSFQRYPIYLEQLATFDALYRDPRGRTVSVAYLGLTQGPADPLNGVWQSLEETRQGVLPFDHADMLEAAVTRLRGKVRYTNIARALLPETFRIEDLVAVYEAILAKRINLTNFRVKLLKIGMLEKVKELTDVTLRRGGRPPHLYQFTGEHYDVVEHDII